MADLQETRQAASGHYKGAVIVYEFMQEAHNNLLKTLIAPSERDECMLGLFLRALSWMRTLKKLNEPSDFQAMVACNRALLETAVDMVLIHQDKSDASRWKMYAWERSAKLKMAESIERFYRESGRPVPSQYEPFMSLIREEKATIEHLRKCLWPKGKHPVNRWTGASSLIEDIKVVDNHWGEAIREDLGMTLTEFYATEYGKMNMHVHGSALGGIRGIPPEDFPIICAFAYKQCGDLAMICSKIILIDYNFAQLFPEIKERWENIKEERMIAYARSVGYL